MKTRIICCLIVLSMSCSIAAHAEKVQNTFWGCGFGMTSAQITEELTKAEMKFAIGNSGNFFLNDAKISCTSFKTVCLIFSPIDGSFYRVIGSNKFTDKREADSCYEASLRCLREIYPNIQLLGHPENAIKMSTYMDDDNAFYLGLFKMKDDKGKNIFCVNINFWNKYFSKQIQDNK